jgi:hypothetical protein
MKMWWVIVLGALLMGACRNEQDILSQVPPPKKTYWVTYRATGSYGRRDKKKDRVYAHVTYLNEQGGTEQRDVALPWEWKIVVRVGRPLYLSVQNGSGEYADVSCEILVNDAPLRESTSSGQYVITTCSGKLAD